MCLSESPLHLPFKVRKSRDLHISRSCFPRSLTLSINFSWALLLVEEKYPLVQDYKGHVKVRREQFNIFIFSNFTLRKVA